MIVGQKVSSRLQAIRVGPGVEFEGASRTATPQHAEADGAYIIKDGKDIHMIQSKEFFEAYRIVKMPQNMRSNSMEL